MHWLILVLIAAATVILLYGLFRWASADAGADAKITKEDFSGEQDWCRLHRSAIQRGALSYDCFKQAPPASAADLRCKKGELRPVFLCCSGSV